MEEIEGVLGLDRGYNLFYYGKCWRNLWGEIGWAFLFVGFGELVLCMWEGCSIIIFHKTF